LNDIIIQTNDKSRYNLFNVMTSGETGEYFEKDGKIKDNLGM